MLRSPFTPDRTTCNRDRDEEPDNAKQNNGPRGAEERRTAPNFCAKNSARTPYGSVV